MPVDLQPTLIGELVMLRPLRTEDWPELFAIASDPLIWEQHPERERYKEEVFRRYFDEALNEVQSGGGAFAIIDRATSHIIGSTRYHGYTTRSHTGDNLKPSRGEIEIGWTFLARSHWGGRYNHEMKRLMLDYIFQFVDTVIFLVGEHNIRSQSAMERIGGIRAGIIEKTNFGGTRSRSVKFIIRKPATHE